MVARAVSAPTAVRQELDHSVPPGGRTAQRVLDSASPSRAGNRSLSLRGMATTCEASRFGEGAMAHSFDYFRSIRKHNLTSVRRAQKVATLEQKIGSFRFTNRTRTVLS